MKGTISMLSSIQSSRTIKRVITQDSKEQETISSAQTPSVIANSFSSVRTVAKAFLITGGNKSQRADKNSQLARADNCLMSGSYKSKSEEEIVVIFSEKHADFENMTFEEARSLVSSATKLGASFTTSTAGKEARFGVIDLST